LTDHGDFLVSQNGIFGSFAVIQWFASSEFSVLFDRSFAAIATPPRKRSVEGYSIEPSKEAALSLKGIKLYVGLYESFLNHILGLFDVSADTDHSAEETVLVVRYQLPKGLAVASQSGIDETLFVNHRSFRVSRVSLGAWEKNGT
jgi:hypothetical protein